MPANKWFIQWNVSKILGTYCIVQINSFSFYLGLHNTAIIMCLSANKKIYIIQQNCEFINKTWRFFFSFYINKKYRARLLSLSQIQTHFQLTTHVPFDDFLVSIYKYCVYILLNCHLAHSIRFKKNDLQPMRCRHLPVPLKQSDHLRSYIGIL